MSDKLPFDRLAVWLLEGAVAEIPMEDALTEQMMGDEEGGPTVRDRGAPSAPPCGESVLLRCGMPTVAVPPCPWDTRDDIFSKQGLALVALRAEVTIWKGSRPGVHNLDAH
jgi:hypothetical protein